MFIHESPKQVYQSKDLLLDIFSMLWNISIIFRQQHSEHLWTHSELPTSNILPFLFQILPPNFSIIIDSIDAAFFSSSLAVTIILKLDSIFKRDAWHIVKTKLLVLLLPGHLVHSIFQTRNSSSYFLLPSYICLIMSHVHNFI